MDDLTTERNFDLQATRIIDMLIFDVLSSCVCTTSHGQSSGRLVQELKACTVALIRKLSGSLMCLSNIFLTCYPWVFVQPDTGERPVDCCRN